MPTTTLDTAPASLKAIWASFSIGSTSYRYVRFDEDVTIESEVFESCPLLDFEPIRKLGGVDSEAVELTAPASLDPLLIICRPYPTATVQVEIGEVNPDDADATSRTLFSGRVIKTIRNEPSRPNLVRVVVAGIKSRLAVPLGIVCVESCAHVFGGDQCGVSVPSHTVTATLGAPRVVTFTGGPGIPSPYFNFGEMSRDGLRIAIARQLSDSAVELVRPAPPEWDGQSVTIRPGCDKSYAGGCATYNNRKNFGGFGVAMTPYNPVIGSGQ